MATLYRCSTPTDWLCPCGRVARALRRQRIGFSEVRVPLRRSRRPQVQALTAQQRVPVLAIDGQAICDSRRILEYLEYREHLEHRRSQRPPTGIDGADSSAGR